MAIGAHHGVGRVIKGARPLAGNAAGLPIVVLIEAANPAIVIYGHIQMDFMACRAELRRLIAHERFEKYAAVWFGIQIDQKIVQRAHHGILARCHLVKSRILEVKVPLAHGALHLRDGVAHHAAQASLRFGPVNDLLDRRIHQAAVEHGRIMAPAAPLRGLRAYYILHVLDTFAIPLVVE